VSDFLARIAARAVGEVPRARPRLPGPLERSASEIGSDEGLEIIDEQVVAPASSPQPAAAAPRSQTPARDPDLAPPSALGGLSGANLAHHTEVPSLHEEARIETSEPATRPRSDAPSPGVVAVQPDVDVSPSAPVDSVAPTVVPATPLPQAGPTPTGPIAAVTVERDDAAVVRVHIGRLDVRANLQEAPKRPPRRAETRPEGLSLSDYLRGRREVG
jgi:hypothetical protein